jgi:hypothetical protein
MKYTVVALLVLALMAASSLAQDADVVRLREAASANVLGTRPVSSPFSLLDFSKMKWTHSYSISFMSGGGSSGSVGLLNSSMFYEFSPKLSLRLDIGILHNSGAIWGDANNEATLLPGFRLDFHPSEKFSLSIGMTRYNPTVAPRYMPTWGFGRYNHISL